MNANLDTMPPRLREGALTDDDRMLYLMDEISRGARRAYDARIAKIGLNQTQWRIIGQLLREPSLTQAGIAKRLELESATIGQAVAGLCGKGLMERRRAKTDGRAWQLILTQELDRLLPQLRESADGLHRSYGGTLRATKNGRCWTFLCGLRRISIRAGPMRNRTYAWVPR